MGKPSAARARKHKGDDGQARDVTPFTWRRFATTTMLVLIPVCLIKLTSK